MTLMPPLQAASSCRVAPPVGNFLRYPALPTSLSQERLVGARGQQPVSDGSSHLILLLPATSG